MASQQPPGWTSVSALAHRVTPPAFKGGNNEIVLLFEGSAHTHTHHHLPSLFQFPRRRALRAGSERTCVPLCLSSRLSVNLVRACTSVGCTNFPCSGVAGLNPRQQLISAAGCDGVMSDTPASPGAACPIRFEPKALVCEPPVPPIDAAGAEAGKAPACSAWRVIMQADLICRI